METPNWDTSHIRVTEKGEEVLGKIATEAFFEGVSAAIDKANEYGLNLTEEGTFRLVFIPPEKFIEGDVVVKVRKSQSGYQMNETELYGRETAPDWLKPYLVPALGKSDYVIMPRCKTDISTSKMKELIEYINNHDPEIADSSELHHKNIGIYDGVPVIFDYAVGFDLF